MRAPEVIRQSGLSWADKWVDQGWVEVDKYSLRHNRYPNVFAVGDVRANSVKRVASAVGEGSVAVQFVHRYLSRVK